MNNDELKYLFEQMLDFIPKDSYYFKNMVKLTKVFKDIDHKIELEHLDDIRESYEEESQYEPNGYKIYYDGDIKCECTLDDAIAKVIKQFTIDPQFKQNQKNNIANCVIEEVDKFIISSGGISSGVKNAIRLGASKYINELIERTTPHEPN